MNKRSVEAVVQTCSVKEVLLEISQNSQVFSCEFCEISKNTFLHKTPLVAVFGRDTFDLNWGKKEPICTQWKLFQLKNWQCYSHSLIQCRFFQKMLQVDFGSQNYNDSCPTSVINSDFFKISALFPLISSEISEKCLRVFRKIWDIKQRFNSTKVSAEVLP